MKPAHTRTQKLNNIPSKTLNIEKNGDGNLNKRFVSLILILSISLVIVAEVNSQGQYVGSKNSDVYHYPSCHYVDNIKDENKIWFSSVQDAINQGYRACKSCNPPSSITDPTPEPEPEVDSDPLLELTGDTIEKFVTNVIDGDTFETLGGYRIRLADIDTPEIGYVGYLEATEYLELLVEFKTVILDVDNITGTDPYGRYVCLVYVKHNSTHYLNVNKSLLNEGYANVIDFTNNEFDPNTWALYSPIDPNFEPETEPEQTPETEPPIAFFVYSPYAPEVNDTITFDASDCIDFDGDIVSYNWDFGDGTTSSDQNPIHAYEKEGSFPVTLTITDNDGLADSFTTTIEDIIVPEFSSWITLPMFVLIAIAVIVSKNRLEKQNKSEKTKRKC